MIIKIYWITRVFGYIASMVGIFLFLAHQADADPATKNLGLALVGIGFLGFFASYSLRAWLRFGPGIKSDETRTR
jgi:hypothetical protein